MTKEITAAAADAQEQVKRAVAKAEKLANHDLFRARRDLRNVLTELFGAVQTAIEASEMLYAGCSDEQSRIAVRAPVLRALLQSASNGWAAVASLEDDARKEVDDLFERARAMGIGTPAVPSDEVADALFFNHPRTKIVEEVDIERIGEDREETT